MALISREEISRYIMTSLGAPIVAVELAQENIGQAIDLAIGEYLATGAVETAFAIIEVGSGKNNMYPLPKDVATVRNVTFAQPLSSAVGSAEDMFQYSMYAGAFGLNWSNMQHAAGNLGVFFEYMQNRNRLIGNEITFRVVDDQILIWPEPRQAAGILIEYSKNAFGIEDKDKDAISTSNSWGVHWIRRMALAISKGMLGKIRGKYSQVAGGPGSESQTLNAQELTGESKEEITALREELFDHKSHSQFFVA